MYDNANIEEVTKKLKMTIQTNIELMKLEVVERTSVIFSRLLIFLLIGFFALLFILFGSITVGFLLSHCFNDTSIGFGIVSCFYLLISVLILIFRKLLIELPIRDKIVRSIFKKQ
jgi:uncharacterized membrane protein YqjE